MAAGVLQLKDTQSKLALRRLRDSLGESYGPFGRLSLLHPFPGAALTCTNRSGKIVQLLKTNNPIIKLILNSLQLHCQHYKEAGLFAALLTLNLIMRGIELPYPQYKVAMVTGYVMSLVCDWLESDGCPAKRRLSLTSTNELMAVVKTFLGSKLTVYGVSVEQLDHVSSLLLQGFLRVSPNTSENSFSFGEHLHFLSCSGHSVHHSVLLGGVVLPISKEDSCLHTLKRCSDGTIAVALFDMSLAGDLEDYPGGVSLEAESNSGLCHSAFDDMVVEKLLGVASRLIELGVGFVGCQKCVHPQVKDYLREKGVYIVERLSSLNFEPVKSVCGAELITSIAALSDCRLGRLRELRSLTLLGETFIQLEGVSEKHCSIVLTSHLKTVVEEMTALCNDAVTIFEQILRSPFILSGGGCMETIAAHYLTQKAKEKATEELLSELQCDKYTLSDVTLRVAESFVAMATWVEHDKGTVAVDSTFHHCWSLPPLSEATPTLREDQSCRCGAVMSSMLPNGCRLIRAGREGESVELIKETLSQNEPACSPSFPRVCDCFSVKLRATELAGDIASTVLQTAWVAVATPAH